jgi:F-type H+-transporting ATPase subunit a
MSVLPVLAADDPLLSHVLPHQLSEDPLLSVGGYDFYVTNHLLMMLLAAVLMVAIFVHLAARIKVRGSGVEAYVTRGTLANFFETLCVYIRDEVARPALRDLTDKYIKFIWTIFFFVLFCNLLGMVPIGPILRFATGNNAKFEHWGGTATGNIAVTAGLALVSFFMIHFIGIREAGFKNWFMHFLPGPPAMWPLMFVLEIAGSLVKPFALCVRLFANMVAGHLVIAAILGMIFMFKSYGVVVGSLFGAVCMSMLELFVAFLQAYIFTFLTVLFIASIAVHDEEHGEHHDAAEAEPTPHAA